MTLHAYDQTFYQTGIRNLAGVDEVGRGPLAGDVYAAAVILPPDFYDERINDSKKLTEKKREALYDVITAHAVAWNVASVSAQVIDEINILQATFRAMREAVAGLIVPPEYVLVDGNGDPGISCPHICVVKGDATSQAIAAASIVAKVTRDRYMVEMAEKYPGYAFERNKGYGSKAHRDQLQAVGPCPIHRMSFLTRIPLGGDGHAQA